MPDDPRDHSSYAEIGSGADVPAGTMLSISSSPEIGPTPVPSRPGSPAVVLQEAPRQKERGRVRFHSNSEASDSANRRISLPLGSSLRSPVFEVFPGHGSQPHSRTSSVASLLRHTFDGTNETPEGSPERDQSSRGPSPSPIRRPRPSVLRNNSFGSVYRGEAQVVPEEEIMNEKTSSALRAHERARRVATSVGTHGVLISPNSVTGEEQEDYFSPRDMHGGLPVPIDDIPLSDLDRQKYAGGKPEGKEKSNGKRASKYAAEASNLVRAHTTRKIPSKGLYVPAVSTPGGATPEAERARYEDYVPSPPEYQTGVLSSLLKLYNNHDPPKSHSRRGSGAESAVSSRPTTPGSSGLNTPRTKKDKWYNQKNAMRSQDTLAQVSAILGESASGQSTPNKPSRPGLPPRSMSEQLVDFASGKRRNTEEYKITFHIANILSRQKYILKICEALMNYGAPTHRLEEYMIMTARVLEVDSSFVYLPGCMIISFNDSDSHTSNVKLVRSVQGIDLGRLKDVHEIYKEVVHDCIDAEEALERLEFVMKEEPLYEAWLLVFWYGFSSVFVAPFAFDARLIDLPVCFLQGCIVGVMQLIIAPQSDMYLNIFEILSAIITSFLARAFGSLRGGDLFCFSALSQSAIVMILPGWWILSGSLELQSRNLIAGAVRMFHAIVYSLFLGFGITIGTALYGMLDPNATSATTCSDSLDSYWDFAFVPPFTMALCFINKAKLKQMPVMMAIAFIGYVVSFYAEKKFPQDVQITGALAAFAIGICGNLYSRLRHGLAAAALLPAIFVQVPSGLAASGSLLAGLASANEITNSTSNANGTILNGTSTVGFDPYLPPSTGHGSAKFSNYSDSLREAAGVPDPSAKHFALLPWLLALTNNALSDDDVKVTSSENLNNIVFDVAYTMVEVAIGITVGLFLSALVVYPFGKKRSGLFSF